MKMFLPPLKVSLLFQFSNEDNQNKAEVTGEGRNGVGGAP